MSAGTPILPEGLRSAAAAAYASAAAGTSASSRHDRVRPGATALTRISDPSSIAHQLLIQYSCGCELSIPQPVAHLRDAGDQVTAIGAERQAEPLGGGLLGGRAQEVGGVQRPVRFQAARGVGEGLD